MEDNSLAKLAIQAALEADWEKVIKINSEILKENPEDCDALNRLARACAELGDAQKARECYCKVLKIDPANSIAVKNLKLLTKSTNASNGKNGYNSNLRSKGVSLDVFLTEPGKTKLVNLVNLAPPATLCNLTCGEKVQIVVKKHQVIIENLDGNHLGAIPDDLAHYLISLTKAGNGYEAYIKAIKTNFLTVIICEKERSAKFVNQPSFLTKRQLKSSKSTPTESHLFSEVEFEGFIEFSE